MCMGRRQHDAFQIQVRLSGHQFSNPAMHQFGTRQEIALNHCHRPLPHRFKVDSAGIQACTEALPIASIG